jgi:hypothetical protein
MIPATEQADLQREKVAAERPERERGAGRGGQPVTGERNRDGEHVRGDHLQQEQPADRRDGPVTRQVQVQVNGPRGDQQGCPGDP